MKTSQDMQQPKHDYDILWEYRNQQEDVLYGRINVFLLAQSMLFVAYAEAKNGSVAGAIAFLGAVTTVLGWLSVLRQVFVLQFTREYVKDKVIAHKDLQKKRKEEEDKLWFHRHFEGQKLLYYSLPSLMLLVWLALILNSIAIIPQVWISSISNTRLTFVLLSCVGVSLSIVFILRNSIKTMHGVKQRLLATLPLMLLLSWVSSGVVVCCGPSDWIGNHLRTLNYMAFWLLAFLVVLLPAFRGQSSKNTVIAQKRDGLAGALSAPAQQETTT